MGRFFYFLWRYLILAPLVGVLSASVLWGLGLISFIITILAMTPTNLSQRTDGIVVLTGGAERVRTGLTLLQNRQGRELLISGVYRGTELDELIEQAHMDDQDIPCCITLGFEAVDTAGNARETAQWAHDHQIKRLRLVTANYHMPRAWLEMRLAMPDVDIIPYPVRTQKFNIWNATGIKLTLTEYHKTILVAGRQLVKQGRAWLNAMNGP